VTELTVIENLSSGTYFLQKEQCNELQFWSHPCLCTLQCSFIRLHDQFCKQ
jgi:hypothetical protein